MNFCKCFGRRKVSSANGRMVPELTLPGFRDSDLYLDVLVEGRLI